MKKILFYFVFILTIITLLFVNIFIINPSQINVREEEIDDVKINEVFDDFIVAFFSDTHYGFTDTEVISKAIEKINNYSPDIIVFGGDLIDDTYDFTSDEKLVELLSSLKANYSKIAVLGECDQATYETKEKIIDIYNQAGFNILDNDAIQFYIDKNNSINFIGIDSIENGEPNIEQAFSGVNTANYTFVVCHTPDIFTSLDLSKTDYVLAGHSHGGQIYFPIINLLNREKGSKEYYRGKTTKSTAILDISNGVGVTNKNARLLADGEVVIFKLNGCN